jgi:uncharacterized protein YecT (DUF1311 family)
MRTVTLIWLIFVAPFAWGDDDTQEALADCHKNQYTQNVCAHYHADIADKSLNEVYQRQLKRLTEKSNKARLVTAQRAWIRFRDANCLYEARGSREEGGSMFTQVFDMCRERMTLLRENEIEGYLACTQNGCPE